VKEGPERSDSPPPAFADVVQARLRALEDGALRAEQYHDIRARFEENEGRVKREYWGHNIPMGLVLTEKDRGPLKRLLRRPPIMRLHRATPMPEDLSEKMHEAAHDGDELGVRAAWSLGDLSRHTVLARIFEVQEFLLEIADAAQGREAKRPMSEREISAGIAHYYQQLYRVQTELNKAAHRRAQYFYMAGALLGLLGFGIIAALVGLTIWPFGYSFHDRAVATGLGCAIAGALGATTSVSWRAALGSLELDPAAGIGALPRLGALRPSLGAIFGLAIYFGLEGHIVDIGQEARGFYFFAFFSFVAGFSERALPEFVDRAERRLGSGASSDPLQLDATDPDGQADRPRTPWSPHEKAERPIRD